MDITKDTRVADILTRDGDIAGVMEALGVRRLGRFSARKLITRLIAVERAARIYRMPLGELPDKHRTAIAITEASHAAEEARP